MFLRDVSSMDDLYRYYTENGLVHYEDKVKHLMIKMGIREIIDGTTQQNLNELKMLEENAITKAHPFDEFKIWDPPIDPIAPHIPKAKPITLNVVGDSNNSGNDAVPSKDFKFTVNQNMQNPYKDTEVIDVQSLPPDESNKVN